jgi:hypothetical protein
MAEEIEAVLLVRAQIGLDACGNLHRRNAFEVGDLFPQGT